MKYSPLILSEPIEQRSALDNPALGLFSDAAFNIVFAGGYSQSFTGESVSEQTALGVPSIWCAVNVLSNSIASLPLQVFKKSDKGPSKNTRNPLYRILHDQVNSDFLTSFGWRKQMMLRLLLTGRAYSFIERDGGGRVSNLWPLDPDFVTPIRQGFKRKYLFRQHGNKDIIYDASEIIDLCWMPASDGLSHYNPIQVNRNSIGLMISSERYASKTFQNGGIPPLVLQGPVGSPAAQARMTEEIQASLKNASNRERNILPLPSGFELKAVGLDPKNTQLLELKKFCVTEVSRIYNLPPSFLHDLSTGTYSNTEQQDLGYAKHSLNSWIELWEQELNAKLFQGKDQTQYCEFNLDGLQRGDFASRMDGLSSAINAAILTPNEARALENREALEGGDRLFLQSATTPIDQSGNAPETSPSNSDDGDE